MPFSREKFYSAFSYITKLNTQASIVVERSLMYSATTQLKISSIKIQCEENCANILVINNGKVLPHSLQWLSFWQNGVITQRRRIFNCPENWAFKGIITFRRTIKTIWKFYFLHLTGFRNFWIPLSHLFKRLKVMLEMLALAT